MKQSVWYMLKGLLRNDKKSLVRDQRSADYENRLLHLAHKVGDEK